MDMRTETESKRVADSRAARYVLAGRTLPASPLRPELLTGCDLVRGIFRGTAMSLRSGRRLRLKPQYPQSFTVGDVDQLAVVIRENARVRPVPTVSNFPLDGSWGEATVSMTFGHPAR
jgi:hypothetical protein